jgi:hypothetical protein
MRLGEPMRWSRKVDEFEVRDVADRLLPYEIAPSPPLDHDDEIDAELLERAVTMLTLGPRNQPRERVENLLSPDDPRRGHRVVDALIAAALVTEDERGRLRRASDAGWH